MERATTEPEKELLLLKFNDNKKGNLSYIGIIQFNINLFM